MSYTPGPWEAHKSGVYAAGEADICIAKRHPQAGDEWPENAALIAAAPDLLAALEQCREYLAQCWSDDPANAPACLAEAVSAISRTYETGRAAGPSAVFRVPAMENTP